MTNKDIKEKFEIWRKVRQENREWYKADDIANWWLADSLIMFLLGMISGMCLGFIIIMLGQLFNI